jgi:hypothetical protein
VADEGAISPDGIALDNFYLARPGADEVQLDLFGDYKSNVALYPVFQNYFRKHQPQNARGVGQRTTPSSCRPGLRPSSATSLAPTSAFSTRGISHWKRMPSQSQRRFASF